MILTKTIILTITSKNINFYKNKGYAVKYLEKIEIKIEDLNINSHEKVLVKCDKCGTEKEKRYSEYIQITKNSEYYCQSCKGEKIKKSVQEKYGVDMYFN